MDITLGQIKSKNQVAEDCALFIELKKFGAKLPKLVLVFDEDGARNDPPGVHVFYQSSKAIIPCDLDVPIVVANTQMEPTPNSDEVLMVTYPGAVAKICRIINGVPVWIP